MTTNFDKSFQAVIKHEGTEYTTDGIDPGGETKFGITQRTLHDMDVNNEFPEFVEHFTEEDARDFYKRHFWDNFHYDSIESLPIASKIFDMAVNMGTKAAFKIAQESCNDIGYKINIDGVMGKQTINAFNRIFARGKEKDLIHSLCIRQKIFYQFLVAKNPLLAKFLHGWLYRAAYQGA